MWMAAVHLNVLVEGPSSTLVVMISYIFSCRVEENACVDALRLPASPTVRFDELRPCSTWIAGLIGSIFQSTVDGRCLYQIIV